LGIAGIEGAWAINSSGETSLVKNSPLVFFPFTTGMKNMAATTIIVCIARE
jgi:hypothetical protein